MDSDSERLHPEGHPGVGPAFMRGILGDSGFEQLQEQSEQAAKANLAYSAANTARAQAVANLVAVLAIAVLAWTVAGIIWLASR